MWIANADGSNPVAFCPPPAGCFFPLNLDWSPDGTRILLDSFNALSLAKVDGSSATPLQTSTSCCDIAVGTPRWSPDGSQIAFVKIPAG
ncbi:MAG: hypothetical protein Q8Q85_04885 [Gemmatimonadales bacterium]|nr:hypothetical protein [Gemmatimonadales bacterium]